MSELVSPDIVRRREMLRQFDEQEYRIFRIILENELNSDIVAKTQCLKLPLEKPQTGIAGSTFRA